MQTNLRRSYNLLLTCVAFTCFSFFSYSQTAILVKDIHTGVPDSDPQELINVNGTVFFAAIDGTNGTELRKSDGTTAGTVMVKDIHTSGSSNPQHLVNVNGVVYFVANNNVNGYELWKSDGTAAGTVMVKDINPGLPNSNPDNLTNVNGVLFFSATNGTNGIELWKSDGTSGGTVMVKDLYTGAGNAQPQYLCNSGGILFFSADNGPTNGVELWKSDGTAAGTVIVKDIRSGSGNSNPANITTAGNIVFFRATEGTNGIELWKSDGTTAGTVLILDINTGGSNSDPDYLTDVNGTLFFAANKSGQGTELWKSDGTGAGTVLVKDIRSGTSGSTPQYITNVNGTAFLSTTDGVVGQELWKSDGTTAGTVLVKDIKVGGASTGSFPDKLCNVNGILFFQADDGTNGIELWKSDGTVAGTVLVQDIRTGTANANPLNLISADGVLYFQATDNTYGKELWKYGYCTAYNLAGAAGGSAVSLLKPLNCQPQSYYQDKTCNLIGSIQPSGSNYINGNVTYKVKIDASVQSYSGEPYVQRHYDIIPALNASTVTATVTLYFTQAEFDAFNSSNGVYPNLPTNAADATGKSYLRITQYHGTSASGLPGTYSGAAELINPADANIIWNAAQSRWEVTFNVTGFSGFFVHTGLYVLPVTFIKTDAKNINDINYVNWIISEPENIDHFVVERSADGIRFTIAANLPAEQNKTQYQFTEIFTSSGKTYYRIKAVLQNGSLLYSRILTLSKPERDTTLNIFPNPANDKLYFEYDTGNSSVIDIFVVSFDGKTLYHDTRLVMANGNNVINVQFLRAGNYILRIVDSNNGKQMNSKFSVRR
jgi:trimeric autotransporter adhesin